MMLSEKFVVVKLSGELIVDVRMLSSGAFRMLINEIVS